MQQKNNQEETTMEMKEINTHCPYCEKPFTHDNKGEAVKKRYGGGHLQGLYHRKCGESVLDGIDATIEGAGA